MVDSNFSRNPQEDNPGGAAADIIDDHRTLGEAQGADVPQNVRDYMTNTQSFEEDEVKGRPFKFPMKDFGDRGAQQQGTPEGTYYFGWSPPPLQGVNYETDLSRIGARLFEHSWEDINAFQNEPVQQAIDAGYPQDEIDTIRGRSGLQPRLNADLAYRTAADPQFASGLRSPSEPIPLTPMDELPSYRIGQIAGREDMPRPDPLADYIEPPTSDEDQNAHARESYANALLRGDVGSPRDFAERYAGALFSADPEADPGSLVRHASQLSASLPSDEDFTDQAIALAKSQGIVIAGPEPTEGKLAPGNISLLDRPEVPNPETGGTSTVWSMSFGTDKGEVLVPRVSDDGRILSEREAIAQYDATGKSFGVFDTPENATAYAKWLHAQQADFTQLNQIRSIKENVVDKWAESDKSLLEIYRQAQLDPEFAQELTAAPPPQPNWLDQFGTGVRDMIGGATQFAVNALPESFTKTIDEVNNTLADAGFPLAKVPVGGIDALERGRIAALSEEGQDASWWRWGGEVAATLPIFTTLGLSGMWGLVAAGATGGAAAAAFHPSTAQDYWSGKAAEIGTGAVLGAGLGAALHGVGRAIASMSPEGAAILRRVIGDMEEPKIKVLSPGDEIASAEVPARDALAAIEPAERAPVVAPAEGASAPVESFTVFAEDATPVAKMGALARDHELGMPLPDVALAAKAGRLNDLNLQNRGITQDEFGPGFFSRLAAGQDAPTLALAQGMDGAQSIGGYLADLGGRLLRDDSGALTLFRTPAQKAEAAGKRDARDYVQGLLVKGMGATARAMEEYGAKFDYYRTAAGDTVNLHKLVNPHMPEWRDEIAKGPMGNPMGTVIGDMIKYVEGRTAGYTMNPNNPLAPVADTIREVNLTLRGHMEDAEKRGLHNLTSYYDDYFRHIWKDPLAADKAFGVARQGASHSFQLRSLPTIEDGIARQLAPKYENPIELVMFDAAEKMRYLNTLDLLDQATNTKSPLTSDPFVYYAASAKTGTSDTRLNGLGSRRDVATPPTVGAQRALVQARATRDAINAQAQAAPTPALLAQQTAARAAVATAEEAAKPGVFTTYAYANPAFAKNWNDNIATGFFARDFTGKVFEQLNYLKNLQTQGQLIGPFFHARTMAMETIAGGYANVASELIGAGKAAVQGRFGDALTEMMHAGLDMAKTTVAPYKILDTMMLGSKAIKIYKGLASDPELDPIVALATGANARFGTRQEMYKFSRAASYWDIWKHGSLGEEVNKQIQYLKGDTSQPFTLVPAIGRMFGFAANEVGRFLNSTTAPLFDYAIPRLKAGVNIERMQTWLRQNPTAGPEQKLAQMRQIVNNTDDRMGEMNMDNVFWPKMFKQAAQLSMISPGWVYGSARFFTNAIGMNMERGKFLPFSEWNQPATTSLIGFAMAYSLFNTVAHRLYTGEMPQDWKDVAIGPLTDAVINGVQQRLMQPSQAKEIFDYGKIVATGIFDPGKIPGEIASYAAGKMPGIGQMIRGMISGKDAIGHDIASLPGGWPAFFLKTLTPILMTSGDQRKKGSGINEWDQFFGAKEVPKFAQDPEGFYKGLQYAADKAQKEEHYRALAENKIYENQREVPELPESMRPKGRTIKVGDPDDPSRMKLFHRTYKSDEYSASQLPPAFGAYNGQRSSGSRSTTRAVTSPDAVAISGGAATPAPRGASRSSAAPRSRASSRRRY